MEIQHNSPQCILKCDWSADLLGTCATSWCSSGAPVSSWQTVGRRVHWRGVEYVERTRTTGPLQH